LFLSFFVSLFLYLHSPSHSLTQSHHHLFASQSLPLSLLPHSSPSTFIAHSVVIVWCVWWGCKVNLVGEWMMMMICVKIE
jgi:hypothetical protein